VSGGGTALRKQAFALVVAMLCLISVTEVAKATALLASYYSDALEGQRTASGAVYKGNGHTAAHRTLPFGSVLEVCYYGCTRVSVNDRNPHSQADLDLSRAAADDIGLTPDGYGVVDAKVIR
jgi:rare lipoprotein A